MVYWHVAGNTDVIISLTANKFGQISSPGYASKNKRLFQYPPSKNIILYRWKLIRLHTVPAATSIHARYLLL